MPFRVSRSRFAELVETVVGGLPEVFAQCLEEVSVEILDQPTAQQLRRARIDSRHTLLGLYEGRPRTHRHVEDSGTLPDRIYIFQEPIQEMSESESDLADQVRLTLLHEIGHHYGMDEGDLDRLGYG